MAGTARRTPRHVTLSLTQLEAEALSEACTFIEAGDLRETFHDVSPVILAFLRASKRLRDATEA